MSASPVELGHVHLKVRDVERSIAFYTEVLGLAVSERVGSYAFLSAGDRHHDLALQAVPEDAPAPGPGVGLYHVAWEVESPADLRAAFDRLSARDVPVSPVDHGISQALYFDDPDGNGVEVYLDTRAARDRSEWGGENRRFDPAQLG